MPSQNAFKWNKETHQTIITFKQNKRSMPKVQMQDRQISGLGLSGVVKEGFTKKAMTELGFEG